jgi:hypothetical protein
VAAAGETPNKKKGKQARSSPSTLPSGGKGKPRNFSNIEVQLLAEPVSIMVRVMGKKLERDDFYNAHTESQSLLTPDTAKTRREQNTGTD